MAAYENVAINIGVISFAKALWRKRIQWRRNINIGNNRRNVETLWRKSAMASGEAAAIEMAGNGG